MPMTTSLLRALFITFLCVLIPSVGQTSERLWYDAPRPPRRAQPLDTDFLAPILQQVLPGVVMLSVTGPMHHHDDAEKSHPQKSRGAAFLLTPDGLILTNEHLVRTAHAIEVQLHDGRRLEATVVGADSPTDVALLRIKATDLPHLQLGDSRPLRVGNWVLTVGNPASMPFTATAGIISALHRRDVHPGTHLKYSDFIQTDAAFNKGSSGGPLVDIHGAVVGMATAMKRTAQDIGYAIPVHWLKVLIKRLHEGPIQRSWVGLQLEALHNGDPGVRITRIVPGGPASSADLLPGDVLLAVNGHELMHPEDVRWHVSLARPGTELTILRSRGGENHALRVQTEALPASSAHPVAAPPSPAPSHPEAHAWAFTLAAEGAPRVEKLPATGAAYQGGLREGDVIVRVGLSAIANTSEAWAAIQAAGSPLELEIERKEDRLYLVLHAHP